MGTTAMRPIIPTPPRTIPQDPKAWEVHTWPQNGVGFVATMTARTLAQALTWAEKALCQGFGVRVSPAL